MTLWRDIVDSLPHAVIALSARWEPTAANTAAYSLLLTSKLTPASIESLMKRNEWLRSMVQSCLDSGRSLSNPRAVLGLKGREVAVRSEVSPLLDRSGRPEGVIVALDDLARSKSSEYDLAAGEVTSGLSPAGLAHEVRNPLTGIKGATELMAAMLPREARAQQYLAVIIQGVDRIASLVEQALAVSSPQRLERRAVNIHQVLHRALSLAGLRPSAPPGVTVEQIFDPSLPEVVGDSAALERAFLNLVKNALEAIGSTGTIRLSTRMEGEFRIAEEGRRHQLIRVEISDSGPGISEEHLRRLFTPFFTTKASGSGLGLVLSQRIVGLHGGRLWAARGGIDPKAGTARDPRGMTFKVTLAAAPTDRTRSG